MFEFGRELMITWQTGQWFVFEIYAFFVWAVMLPRMFFAWRFYSLRRARKIHNYPERKYHVSAVVTVFREDLADLQRCLSTLKASLAYGAASHEVLVMVDGVKPGEVTDHMLIARRYADVVITGNYRNKRKNLKELIGRAQKDILLLVDSDTFFEEKTVYELCKPFADSGIGGTTTAQLVHNPKTLMQHMSFWFENARLNSSMAAASLFQQVACLPGRAYAVRKETVVPCLDELVDETFMGRECISGDDRMLTNSILRAGKRTLLVPSARITTIAPEGLRKTTNMWIRWGRSSQRYTLQSPWLFRYPMAAFIYWTDILITVSTIFIIFVHWPYMVFSGHTEQTLLQMVLFSSLGMLMTMMVRQAPHLWQYPRFWKYLPVFVAVATYLQTLRFYSLLTMHRVNTWGTRPGADKQGADTTPEVWYSAMPVQAVEYVVAEDEYDQVANL